MAYVFYMHGWVMGIKDIWNPNFARYQNSKLSFKCTTNAEHDFKPSWQRCIWCMILSGEGYILQWRWPSISMIQISFIKHGWNSIIEFTQKNTLSLNPFYTLNKQFTKNRVHLIYLYVPYKWNIKMLYFVC